MKRIITVLFATGLLAALATGCKEEYKTYSDAEYVLFADTLATYAVLQDQDYFSVPVSSTVACDYDRTFGVEIIDQGSNAVEGKHYRLLSNTITIKAGSRKADVTWSLIVVPAILIAEVLLFKKWCHKLCPLSAFMSLIAKLNRTFKPTIDNAKCRSWMSSPKLTPPTAASSTKPTTKWR